MSAKRETTVPPMAPGGARPLEELAQDRAGGSFSAPARVLVALGAFLGGLAACAAVGLGAGLFNGGPTSADVEAARMAGDADGREEVAADLEAEAQQREAAAFAAGAAQGGLSGRELGSFNPLSYFAGTLVARQNVVQVRDQAYDTGFDHGFDAGWFEQTGEQAPSQRRPGDQDDGDLADSAGAAGPPG